MIQCLILVCGPPACLKSTLIQVLQRLSNSSINTLQFLCVKNLINQQKTSIDNCFSCTFLLFDDLFADYEDQIINNESNWKVYRSLIADEIERKILFSDKQRTEATGKFGSLFLDRLNERLSSIDVRSILIIEDNFYYSSMRHRYRQIAQRAQIGFACVHLHADLFVARKRNRERSPKRRVPDASLENIFTKYEPPTVDELSLDTSERGLTVEHLHQVLQRIQLARSQPEQNLQSMHDEQRRQATQINRDNFLHQTDQKLRKFISKYLQQTFSTVNGPIDKKIFAQKINDQRQLFLQAIRQGSILVSNDQEIESVFEEFFQRFLQNK